MDNLLFFALMYKDKEMLTNVVNELKDNFGNVVSESPEYDFNFTEDYEEEFGSGLKKTIIVFDNKIDRDDLANLKIICSQIEDEFCSDDNKRAVNIDPGYVNNKEVVLASFKGKRFKESLSNDVFAHKVLEFENRTVKDFFHTFADFKSNVVKEFFIKVIK
tara:strand:- start:6769 stop:7251 length:483 start_codon:yes stop_codon:yes gene_type:complete